MAKRISLREYQEGVVARLKTATATAQVDARLGVSIGGENWLVDLADVAEVMPVPTVSSVPLAQSWFRGVANVRGNLVSVSDVGAYFGGAELLASPAARLMLLHPRHILHSAILVERMLGLKHLADMQAEETQHPRASGCWRDAAGQQWRALDVPALVADPVFLQAGLA
ncbi:twitching motility protein PilI [Andreprevotia lacus DSM 23236]|jgi:twitching motility protein PilI|uniref:Twitching motility protein PilI n=1 Tax=Andreprevotia lacus DSM 23236 TaxID=1121001 RepID=A0A1W1XTT4_9NEIS|nr:chemotaxis protein CheW [Andreprevotia lacus]SMC26941.1 twitching motility protein PilI [Andreprevotia lacus DSM 23236]